MKTMIKDEQDGLQPEPNSAGSDDGQFTPASESDLFDISLQDILDELATSTATNEQPSYANTTEVFDAVMDHVVEVDFAQESGSTKPSNMQIVVLVVRFLMEAFQSLEVGLCRIGGEIRCFTGSFWMLLGTEELEPFFGSVAEQMSVNQILAEFHVFRKSLVKQFYTVATIPSRERPEDKVLVNYRNGTLEIRPCDRLFRWFDKNDYQTYVLNFDYDPHAEAPLWKEFLDHVLPDPSSQAVLAEAIAYAFSQLKLEKVVVFYGSGANGKSVALDVIQALLGNENVTNFSFKNLDHPYYRAKIANKLLNISSEATVGISPDEFKKLASGEPIDARNVYEEPVIVRRYAKLMFSSNELPIDVEYTDAYFRRYLIIPFTVTVPKENRDPNLAKRIIATELPGILNWVLEGLDRLNDNKAFSPCPAADKELERYQLETNSVALFCEEQGYIPSTDETQRMKLVDLHSKYRQFCITNGFRAVSTRKFRKRLEQLEFGCKKLNVGLIVFVLRNGSRNEDSDISF